MPITPFLKNQAFDPEHVQAMGFAFLKACVRLRLTNTDNLATQTVAEKIFKIAQTGERDPDTLYQLAILEFGIHDTGPPGPVQSVQSEEISAAIPDEGAANGGGAPRSARA